MANFQTLKNTLKKLESRQKETDTREYCGVIYVDEYEEMADSGEGFKKSTGRVGYLVIQRPLTIEAWELEYAR